MTTPAASLPDALREIVGPEHVSSADAERHLHSHDESDHPPALPDIVVWPDTTTDVSRIVGLAHEHRVPVTGWGAASSTEGHPIPVRGGIVVDFRRMNRVLAVHAEDFQAEVEPGVLRLDLERHLSHFGLFFPPDPGANASVGGMVANNAAGIRALKYGATSANVLGLEVVLADGRVIRTGSRSVKQSAGYDLTKLIVGSEGTLGLVTCATLKLAPILEHSATTIVAFPGVEAAARAVHEIIGNGLEPAALELVHQDHVAWMNEEEQAGIIEAPSLLIEFTGASADAVRESMTFTRALCEAHGSTGATEGLSREDRSRIWRLRHGIRERARRRYPAQNWVSMDVAVPISEFPKLVEFSERRCREEGIHGRVVGHAGDGNMHMGLNYEPDDPVATETAVGVGNEIVDLALDLGGTCSGEHGIGIGKKHYMLREHGEHAIAAMWAIKRALDPHGILNPGKVLPDLT